jgi:holo-[acyl-carrier protein] synthase
VIVGVGIDLVEVERIAGALDRHGERFRRRVFTEAELAYCRGRKLETMHLAGRWAAKEAAAKALGTGVYGSLRFHDVEITNDERGKPVMTLSGDAARIAEEIGASRLHVSISHTRFHSTAVVVAEGGES